MQVREVPTLVLGGGIAGLSFASEVKEPLLILEKENHPGGLCRSFPFSGVMTDIGPHIIFSKHEEVLQRHSTEIRTSRIRRLNRIFSHGKLIKYPFENDLNALPENVRDFCLMSFLNNPYETTDVSNMYQFFLKTFGEGISQEYLIPYNRKIWKYDPAFLDLQMVERIPKPPIEDVIKSAKGIPTEGYTHQLYFYYPTDGGFQCLVDYYVGLLGNEQELLLSQEVTQITKERGGFLVRTNDMEVKTSKIVSTLPLPDLIAMTDAPPQIKELAQGMLFNSIHIVLIELDRDVLQDQFALYVPDEEIIFHRMSRLNFLGPAYVPYSGGALLMCEVTFRKDSSLSMLNNDEIFKLTIDGVSKIVGNRNFDVLNKKVRTFENAYVIYDLDHRKRTDAVLSWLRAFGITATGRFGKFEYQNSDQVVKDSIELARVLKTEGGLL